MHTCHCGKEVRLGAQRITVERRSGVYHYIVHRDETDACDGPWTCIAVKPYPKDETQREYAKMIRRWNEHQSTKRT